MILTVFYCDAMQAPEAQPGSPSPSKPARVMESWQALGLPLEIVPPEPASVVDLCLAHDPAYVEGILSCERRNGFGTHSAAVAASLPWTVGSMTSAALHVLANGGAAASPTSGFHHAGHNFGGAYCTFNGLMVAARKALNAGAGNVGILDMDQHFGNGSEDIIKHFGLKDIVHWTLGGSDVKSGQDAGVWVNELPELIEETFAGCDLLLYQAGADCHVDDPLGGIFTTVQMRLRDQAVFETCMHNRIPVAWNLAGGYQKPIRKVLDLHDQTARECLRAFGDNSYGNTGQNEEICNPR